MNKNLPSTIKWFLLVFFLSANVHAPAAGEAVEEKYRVLFDNTKAQTAGNADWIIDSHQPYPLPHRPRGPDHWAGALSAWAYRLWRTERFILHTLPRATGRITYGDASNPQDLSRYHEFVIVEPNAPYSGSEIEAVVRFVRSGGGLFMIANHAGSDRNGDGHDPPQILNEFKNVTGIRFYTLAEGRPLSWFSEVTANVSPEDQDPLINGPFGRVKRVSLHGATAMQLLPRINPYVKGHVWRGGAKRGTDNVVLASTRVGKGRVAALGDSSPADDGVGTPGKSLYPNWRYRRVRGVTNDVLILNATAWLAGYAP